MDGVKERTMITFNGEKNIAESFDDSTTTEIQLEEKVYRTKVSKSTLIEKEYSSHRRQNSSNNKKKLRKAAIIDAPHLLPSEPPFIAPPSRKYVPVKMYSYINPCENWS